MFPWLRGENLSEEEFQRRVWDSFQAKRRFAHFTDARAKRFDVFRTKIGMAGETDFEFVDRFRSNARGKDLVETAKSKMIAFEPGNARFNPQTR